MESNNYLEFYRDPDIIKNDISINDAEEAVDLCLLVRLAHLRIRIVVDGPQEMLPALVLHHLGTARVMVEADGDARLARFAGPGRLSVLGIWFQGRVAAGSEMDPEPRREAGSSLDRPERRPLESLRTRPVAPGSPREAP